MTRTFVLTVVAVVLTTLARASATPTPSAWAEARSLGARRAEHRRPPVLRSCGEPGHARAAGRGRRAHLRHPRRAAHRVGWDRSRELPPGWDSRHCCRISACLKASGKLPAAGSRLPLASVLAFRMLRVARVFCRGAAYARRRVRCARRLQPRRPRASSPCCWRRHNPSRRRRISPRRCPPGSTPPASRVKRSSSSGVCSRRGMRGDRKAIADVMTPAMAAEILRDLDERARARSRPRSLLLDAGDAGGVDRCRRALGFGPFHRHRSRGRRCADAALDESLEPVQAARRLDRMAPRRHPADRVSGGA